jgi:hypothetical protein
MVCQKISNTSEDVMLNSLGISSFPESTPSRLPVISLVLCMLELDG